MPHSELYPVIYTKCISLIKFIQKITQATRVKKFEGTFFNTLPIYSHLLTLRMYSFKITFFILCVSKIMWSGNNSTHPISKWDLWSFSIYQRPHRPKEMRGQREDFDLAHYLFRILSWTEFIYVGSDKSHSLFFRGILGLVLFVKRIFVDCVIVDPFGEMIGNIECSVIVGTIFEIWKIKSSFRLKTKIANDKKCKCF